MAKETPDDLFFWMGFCLFTIQAAESAIASAIQIALPEKGVISVESLEAAEQEHRKKTIGQLVRKLNNKARIDPGIEQRLVAFISNRNEFVHSFQRRFDLNGSEGHAQAIAFCQELASEAFGLTQVFCAVSCAAMDRLQPVTDGAVGANWDTMPKDIAEPVRELARIYPAIIRERK